MLRDEVGGIVRGVCIICTVSYPPVSYTSKEEVDYVQFVSTVSYNNITFTHPLTASTSDSSMSP